MPDLSLVADTITVAVYAGRRLTSRRLLAMARGHGGVRIHPGDSAVVARFPMERAIPEQLVAEEARCLGLDLAVGQELAVQLPRLLVDELLAREGRHVAIVERAIKEHLPAR